MSVRAELGRPPSAGSAGLLRPAVAAMTDMGPPPTAKGRKEMRQMNNLSRFLSEIAWGLDEQAGALADDREGAIHSAGTALRDYGAQLRTVADAATAEGIDWSRIDGEIGVDLEPGPDPLIRIIFTPADVEAMASEAKVPIATAMSRAGAWSRAIEEVATGLCSAQLLSVVKSDQP